MVSRKVVVSMAVKPVAEALRAFTEPTFRAYAEKIGADYFCIEQNLYPDDLSLMHLNKGQLFDLLEQYDRIIYLDLDTVVSPQCRDLFAEVPQECLGVWMQPPDQQSIGYVEKIKEHFGDVSGWHDRYFNSGVMVLSREHVHLFDRPSDLPRLNTGDNNFVSDQHILNWNAQRLGVRIHELSPTFNWSPEQRWLNPWAEILHFWSNGFEWPALWSGKVEIETARLRQIAYLLQLWELCPPDDPASARKYYAASQQWTMSSRAPLNLPTLDCWFVEKFQAEIDLRKEKWKNLKRLHEYHKDKLVQKQEKIAELRLQRDHARQEIRRLKQVAKKPKKPNKWLAALFKGKPPAEE